MRIVLLLLACLSLPVQAADNLRILLTNDDGFNAPGIRAIHTALKAAGHDVFLVAPATQQSGMGSAMTGRGVKVTAHPGQVWAVHGTPSDAVRVGLGNILYDDPPDLVVSGANLAQNAGQDILISGTVGAALAAHNLGVPAIAISVGIRIEERSVGYPSTIAAFKGAGRTVARLIDNLDLRDLTDVLNINYPPVLPLDVRGVRWSELSNYSVFSRRYNLHADGLYRPQLQAPNPKAKKRDVESLMDGYITMTFLDGDMSTDTRRSQRYLERYLLDRDYDPVQPVRQRPSPVPSAAKTMKPEAGPAESTSDSQSSREQQPKAQQPAAQKMEQGPAQTAPAEPGEMPSAHIQHRVPQNSKVTTEPAEGERAMAQAEAVETEEEKKRQESRKKKPDSWLRRIFDPASWRR